MKKTIKLALVGALTLAGGVAFAQGPGMGGMRGMSPEERQQHHTEMLAKYDANKDGKLDEAERARLHEDKVTERFKSMDKNNDGMLSIDEFKAAHKDGPMGKGMGKGMGPGCGGHGGGGHGFGQ